MKHLFLTVTLLLFLQGCAPNPGASLPAVMAESTATPALMTPTPALAHATPLPLPSPKLLASMLPPEPTLPLAIPSICSPLASVPIDELESVISAPYHPPPAGQEARHHGVDFAYYRRGDRLTIEGETIQAAFSGRVAAAIAERMPYGNLLIIETRAEELPAEISARLDLAPGEGLYLLYAHMAAAPGLQQGETVQACQVLGQVGKSGNANVAHLHLEVRRGAQGASFPSMAYYDVAATEAERAVYIRWRTSGEFTHFDPISLFFPEN